MKKITLRDKDFDRFVKALVKPRKPNKALLDAVKTDKEFMDGIRKGAKACKEGRVRLWSEIKKELNL